MKNLMSKITWLPVALLLVAGAASAENRDRKYTYACEVSTEAGVSGLVMVQADTLEEAKTAAAKADAKTLSGGSSRAMSVVQCILANDKARFSDSHFQKFYRELPK